MATVDPSNEPESYPRQQDPTRMTTLLRRARERRGLTLEQVALETKIPIERLAALEQHGLSGGNGGFYQRARIRAYARAVGLNERVLLTALEREAPPAAPAPAPQPSPARTRSSQAMHVVTLVACGVIVAGISRMIWEDSNRGVAPPAPVASSSQWERPAIPTTGSTPAVVQPTPPTALSAPVVAIKKTAARDVEETKQSAATTVPTELVITTEPADARVAVNGIGWGSTPITIRHLPPGEKRIRLTKDGYVAVERLTRLVADRAMTVDIRLEPAP